MDLNKLNKIKPSNDLDKILDSALKIGKEKLIASKKRKKHKALAASAALILLSSFALNNKTVVASINNIYSAFDINYFNIENTLKNEEININKEVFNNDVSLRLDNALIDYDEIHLEVTLDLRNLDDDTWKLKNVKDLDSSLSKVLHTENTPESLAFKEAAKKVYLGKGIDESLLLVEKNEEFRGYRKEDLLYMQYLYDWGISDEGHFYGGEEFKDKAGAIKSLSINEKEEEEIRYASPISSIPECEYTLSINGEEVRFSSLGYLPSKSEDNIIKSVLTFKLPSNLDKSKNLDLKLSTSSFSVHQFYPVTLDGNWTIDFSIDKNNFNNISKTTVNKEFYSKGIGNVTIKAIVITPMSLTIEYEVKDKELANDSWKMQSFDAILNNDIPLELKSNNTVSTSEDSAVFQAKYSSDFLKDTSSINKIKITPKVVNVNEDITSGIHYVKPIIINIKS